MVDDLRADQVKLRVHGLAAMNDRVRARVFARQLGALVKSLEAADKSANGGTRFDYVIAELKNESASATLSQVAASKKRPIQSGVQALGEMMTGITQLNRTTIEKYADCIQHVATIAKGAGEEFSHTDLRIEGFKPIRVDDYFVKQVERALKLTVPPEDRFFAGVAIGTFDGEIKEVDLRGDTPRVKLILSAGGKEIDCVCSGMSTDELREALDRRVAVEARAHYSGDSGLPERIEILNLKVIKERGDFLRWKGRFEGLRSDDYEDEGETD